MHELGVDASAHVTCPRCYAVFLQRYPVCALDGTALVEMSEDLLIGKTIAARYVVEAFVGEGGMGRVYRARHTALSRRFAIKVLFGEYAAEQKARARFAREAEAASRLDHPNVVPVLDYGETETKLPYLAMDFVEGRDLLHILDRERRLPLARVLRLAKDMCRGLAHAHARGLVHRDFKPGNVLVVDDHGREVPRIADFGLAIDPGELSSRLTTGRIIFGSPAYMSPEQASQGEIDARSDQFSLGVTLYEMITGRLPFSGSAVEQLTQNASSPRPSLAAAVGPQLKIPTSVERLVHKLMAIWPNGRYAGMDGVITELEKIETELASGLAVVTARTPMLPTSGPTQAGPALAAEPAGSKIPTGPAEVAAELGLQPAGFDERKVPTHLLSRHLGSDEEEAAARRRRRGLYAGIALVALLGLGVGAYVGMRGGGGDVRPPVVLTGVNLPTAADAGLAVAADAGLAVVAPATPDAAPVVAAPVETPDAGVARPVKNGRRKPPKRVAVVTRPPKETKPPTLETPPAPTGEITAKGFTDYYKQVGSALERLRQQKGEDAAAPFRDRYFAIPLNDALRTPALRVDAMKKLGALERDIRAALR